MQEYNLNTGGPHHTILLTKTEKDAKQDTIQYSRISVNRVLCKARPACNSIWTSIFITSKQYKRNILLNKRVSLTKVLSISFYVCMSVSFMRNQNYSRRGMSGNWPVWDSQYFWNLNTLSPEVHNDGRTIWCSHNIFLNAFLWFFFALNESKNGRCILAQLQFM